MNLPFKWWATLQAIRELPVARHDDMPQVEWA